MKAVAWAEIVPLSCGRGGWPTFFYGRGLWSRWLADVFYGRGLCAEPFYGVGQFEDLG